MSRTSDFHIPKSHQVRIGGEHAHILVPCLCGCALLGSGRPPRPRGAGTLPHLAISTIPDGPARSRGPELRAAGAERKRSGSGPLTDVRSLCDGLGLSIGPCFCFIPCVRPLLYRCLGIRAGFRPDRADDLSARPSGPVRTRYIGIGLAYVYARFGLFTLDLILRVSGRVAAYPLRFPSPESRRCEDRVCVVT